MTVISTLFENIFEILLGYEGLFYLLSDDPQLVEDVFNRWGQIVYDFYSSVIGLEAVGGIFHVDDMGFQNRDPDLSRRSAPPGLPLAEEVRQPGPRPA